MYQYLCITQVYDGQDANATLLGTYCNDTQTLEYDDSTSNTMFVCFSSDTSGIGAGFSSTFYEWPPGNVHIILPVFQGTIAFYYSLHSEHYYLRAYNQYCPG